MSSDTAVRRRDVRSVVLLVLLVIAGLVGAAAIFVGVIQRGDEAADASLAGAPALETDAPVPLGDRETYVLSEVLPNGDLRVTQWIHSTRLLFNVLLVPPPIVGADDLAAKEVQVVADGRIVEGRELITSGQSARYSFVGATSIKVSYRLSGALALSSSARGRALARLTSLDVSYTPRSRRVTRTITAPQVLSLACSEPTATTGSRPCGTRDSRDQWTVKLAGKDAQDRVVAALSTR